MTTATLRGKDLTGQRFGLLLVREFAGFAERRRKVWLCLCDCGQESLVRSSQLRSGRTRSCGCLKRSTAGKPRQDLLGKRFGRLRVMSFLEVRDHYAWWNCRCDCGNERAARTVDLNRGRSTSCGCKKKEATRRVIHGRSRDPIYFAWVRMRQLASQGSVLVCDRWQDFEKFAKDVGDRPPGHVLARRDKKSHFNPFNCRWVPRKAVKR